MKIFLHVCRFIRHYFHTASAPRAARNVSFWIYLLTGVARVFVAQTRARGALGRALRGLTAAASAHGRHSSCHSPREPLVARS